MLLALIIGFCGLTAVCGSISGHINSGICVCVTGTGVNARHDAGLHGRLVGSVNHGECYTFNGGIHTVDGYTWYQLQHVHGGLAWVAGDFLQTSTHSHCTSHSNEKFASGIVSQDCMKCICENESGCKSLGCAWDVNSNSCGYFQIKEAYWKDCGSPGPNWESCSRDLQCASQCVQDYMARYIGHYGCARNCESYARMHNGGPAGCKHTNTLGYWGNIKRKGCIAGS